MNLKKVICSKILQPKIGWGKFIGTAGLFGAYLVKTGFYEPLYKCAQKSTLFFTLMPPVRLSITLSVYKTISIAESDLFLQKMTKKVICLLQITFLRFILD